jgi:hypothetical protein
MFACRSRNADESSSIFPALLFCPVVLAWNVQRTKRFQSQRHRSGSRRFAFARHTVQVEIAGKPGTSLTLTVIGVETSRRPLLRARPRPPMPSAETTPM